MDGAWNRLGVFLELREDPGAQARKQAERSRPWGVRALRVVLGLAVAVAVFIAFFCVVALIAHLIVGDTTPHRVLVDGLRLSAWAFTVAMLVFYVGRWVYWLADRWVR